MHKRFNTLTKEISDGSAFKSDIDLSLSLLTDFLRNTHSSDIQLWDDRRARHNGIEDRKLLSLLNKNFTQGKKISSSPPPSP